MSVDIWKSPSTQYRREKASLRATCIKNAKFKINPLRRDCHYVGYFYYSENLHWAAKNLRLHAAPGSWVGHSWSIQYINTVKGRGDSAHPCRRSTPMVNNCDLNLLTWTQTSKRKCNILIPTNRHPLTPFSRGTRSCALSKSITRVGAFPILPRFLENFLEREKLVCSATAGTKTAMGIFQICFNYFVASLCIALGAFQGILMQGDTLVGSAFLPFPFLWMGMITPVSQSFVTSKNIRPFYAQ